MKKWSIEAEEKVLETPIFTVYDRLMQFPLNKKSGHFYVIGAPSWINIVALTEDRNIILVQQYRHGIDDLSWEIPGGAIDQGDDDQLVAARRELAEETGYTSESWEELGCVSTNPAIFSNYCYFYLATHCRKTESQHLDPFEDINVDEIPLRDFLARIRSGEIHHSLVVAAVARLLLKKPELTD